MQKGLIVERLTANRGGLLVAIGDDRTDEDLFAAVPESGLTFHVGSGASRAKLRLATPAAVRSLLSRLL